MASSTPVPNVPSPSASQNAPTRPSRNRTKPLWLNDYITCNSSSHLPSAAVDQSCKATSSVFKTRQVQMSHIGFTLFLKILEPNVKVQANVTYAFHWPTPLKYV
ncbi:homeodomain-like/winged-helix DNA-binding family protein [Striga asiatica]|uniref:Homeodomain-like/winged-helix DNA-binding family protein n=1 Tax=Striga asiatica TaxID=4170 RepID=A0A5A7PH62_STRAF|nr:homeodomain-like/winged-helix DNA-binding family protein [Striga asiatica]